MADHRNINNRLRNTNKYVIWLAIDSLVMLNCSLYHPPKDDEYTHLGFLNNLTISCRVYFTRWQGRTNGHCVNSALQEVQGKQANRDHTTSQGTDQINHQHINMQVNILVTGHEGLS